MVSPAHLGRKNFPGLRGSQASPSPSNGTFQSSRLSSRPPVGPSGKAMQQAYRHYDYNSSSYKPWNAEISGQVHETQNDYVGTLRAGSALSIDNSAAGDRTPLPRARNQSALRSRSQSLSKPRFWTPQVESSPVKQTGNTSGVNGLYQKFLASFRRNKNQQTGNQDVGAAGGHATSLTDTVSALVLLLDGEEVSLNVNKRVLGIELIKRICDGQDIIETDYFGITYTDKKLGTWFWLDLDKKIIKQVPNVSDWQFYFQV
uniref:FERM domain-containing protein n=2 Tax=Mesocestoides corti TaxID=53468 RepID=A0A5K3FTQ8_MESCO